MLKRFLSYYKPHKKVFVLDMLASFFVAFIGIVYPIVTRNMLNDFIPNRNYRLIVICGTVLLALYIVRMLLRYYVQYVGHMMGIKMQAQMRSDMFCHLEKLPYKFFDDNETGRIMSRMTNDLMEVSELAHHGPENIIICGVSIIIAFIYLAAINIWLTLLLFITLPFMLAIAIKLKGRMQDAFARGREYTAGINAAVESSISGIRVTKAFTNAEKEREKFEENNVSFIYAKQDAYKAMGIFHSATSFITDVFNVIVLIAGGLFMYAGQIDFADYSTFIVSVNLFLTPLTTLINFMEQYQNGVTGFERFVKIMDEKPEEDAADAEDIDMLDGHIEFRGVTCRYDEDKNVLNGISLNIEKGSTFALVGPSGGGKTTICHLIPRFYNVNSGEILIDGIDINRISLSSLRRNVGIVQQDVYLFNASMRDNILYGKLDATEEEIIEAAKRANIHDYIMSLPEGYDTQIGERGVRLSGGQKQRLSIARVFLKNPPVLILDEATSALDNTTEILIQQALDELCEGRTTIVVAHRLSTIKNADEIAVVSDGRIVEQGHHIELMEANGAYAELYNLQFKANTL